MKCELVFNNVTTPRPIPPSVWKAPLPGQMVGSGTEQLIELAGRGCYDSLGSGRPSREYHQHLLEVKHYSVHEHVHVTIETDLPACIWHGIPDYTLVRTVDRRTRITLNLRHCLEWPDNVVYRSERGDGEEMINRWGNLLREVAYALMPNVLPKPPESGEDWELMVPEYDTEQFITLFLEDSLVWSHEQVRHRHNISQRSGRFCDQTDRDDCIHPLLREYLNEAGYLALNPEDGHNLWRQAAPSVDGDEIRERTQLGNAIGSHLAQAKFIYAAVADRLQDWIARNKKMDRTSARKQARSAARYYLGSSTSTEMLFTASLRNWRALLAKRCSPAADAAINDLMEQARRVIEDSMRAPHLH